MPNTFSQTISLTCPQCGQPFDAEIFLIVDASERPDLLKKIKNGTLHHLTCPHCQHELGNADAPLLFFRPDAELPILYSPAQQTTQDQDEAVARDLVERLRQSLGDAWQDDWLKDGLPGVQRQVLPAVLSDDPEAALRELAEKRQRELERLRRIDRPGLHSATVPILFPKASGAEGLARAIAAALRFDPAEDPVAVEMQRAIRERGVEAVLQEVSEIAPDEPLGQLILAEYRR